MQEAVAERERLGDLVIETATELAAERGATVDTRLEVGSPAEVIADVASHSESDHIVLGESRTEQQPGPIAEAVIDSCEATVTIVRPRMDD